MENVMSRMSAYRKPLFIGGPVMLIIIVAIVFFMSRGTQSTDDAYVRAAISNINANINGQVTDIYVQDNQAVTQGTPLFRIDARPYRIAIAKAKADLANAYLQVRSLKMSYQEKVAEVAAAQSTVAYTQEELKRHKKMTSAGLASQIELDKATHAFDIAQQDLIAKQKQLDNILVQLNNDPNIAANQLPSIQAAEAAVQQAKLNFSYTEIKAPASGIVTKVEKLQVGDYVKTGEPVFALISTDDVWIEANFKETQIGNIHPGDTVNITLDAFPDRKWHGEVASISPGTGSAFALLPAENATGNWVKIVQRLPIRITIENPDHLLLSSGLSATVSVDVAGQKA